MKKSEIKATPNMTLGEIQYVCARYFDKKCDGCPMKTVCHMIYNKNNCIPYQWDLGNGHRVTKGEDI